MLYEGYIITTGKKAVTIQSNQHQYYAPLENLDINLLNLLNKNNFTLHVKFNIDENSWSGFANGRKRYYAINVKLNDTIII